MSNMIKFITLTQPWATLVALGVKRIETRSWRTPYRGLLGIHAAKSYPDWAREFARRDPQCRAALEAAGEHWDTLTLGEIVAVTELRNCIRTEELVVTLSEGERAFGNYEPGRWAWVLGETVAIEGHTPHRGSLGLWETDPYIAELFEQYYREGVPGR